MRKRLQQSKRWTGTMTAIVVLGAITLVTGCANFFVPLNGSGGSGGSGGTTVGGSGANYAYVVNSATGTVSGFLIGAGTLTATPGSPYTFGFVPQSAVVTRTNNFLYVAGPAAIYSFPINADGSLASSALGAVAIASEIALAVSPDGQWLFGLNSQSTTLDEWQINRTTGAIAAVQGAAYTITDGIYAPSKLQVSPAGNYVFAALGTAGDHVFTLNTSTGFVASSQQLSLGSNLTSDNSLITDSKGSMLYIARSGANGGLAAYTIGAAGLLIPISGSPFATGQGTFDVAVDGSGKYVYAANRKDGTISGFSIGSGGVLTALNGSPFASGALVTSLVADRSGKYLLAAAAGGSPDLTMYTFDASVGGKLDVATTAVSGTDPAGSTLVSSTH